MTCSSKKNIATTSMLNRTHITGTVVRIQCIDDKQEEEHCEMSLGYQQQSEIYTCDIITSNHFTYPL